MKGQKLSRKFKSGSPGNHRTKTILEIKTWPRKPNKTGDNEGE